MLELPLKTQLFYFYNARTSHLNRETDSINFKSHFSVYLKICFLLKINLNQILPNLNIFTKFQHFFKFTVAFIDRMSLITFNFPKNCFELQFYFPFCPRNVRFLDQTDKNCFKLRKHAMESRERHQKITSFIRFILAIFHWKWKRICYFCRFESCLGPTSKTNTSMTLKCVKIFLKYFRNLVSRSAGLNHRERYEGS